MASFGRAQTAAPSPIKVDAPWLRATPKSAPVIGGYATITNTGTAPDRLIGASVPMAEPAAVHSMSMTNGVMRMEALKDGLDIAPGATVTLAPSGYHLMFPKPTQALKEGQSVQGTLQFAKAGAVSVTFAVGGMAAKVAPGTHGGHDGGGMHGMKM